MNLKLINVANAKQDRPGRMSVVNADTGEEVKWVSEVDLRSDISTNFVPVATIRVEVEVDLNIAGYFEEVKRGTFGG